MTAKDKHDESKPSARFAVLMGLFWVGQDAGLLSIEALRTSTVSMAYAAALATAALATLRAVLKPSGVEQSNGKTATMTGPAWHESTVFSDPWYQVPAIFCVFILASRFVLDLAANPPETERAVWFLASLGVATLAMAFGLIGGGASKKGSKGKDEDDSDKPLQAETAGEPLSPVEATLRDPWFSVPATAIFFLHFARDGLNQIEEEPDSLMTTVTLLMPVAVLVVGLVTLAVSRARRRRREGAMVVGAGSVGVTGDSGGPEA